MRKKELWEYRQPTFKEAYEIERRSLENMISPKYDEFEIDARATARAIVRAEMGMNFHQGQESAFVRGAKWAKDKLHPRGSDRG